MVGIGTIKIKHQFYIMMMSILFLFVIIRNIAGINIPVGVFLVVGLMVSIFCDKEEIVAFICSMGPFEAFFQYRYMILIGTVFLIIKARKINFVQFIPVLLMMVWELVHFFNDKISVMNFAKEFIVTITLGVLLMQKPIDCEDGLPMQSLAACTLFSCIISLGVNRFKYGYSIFSGIRLGTFEDKMYDLSESYNGIINPNSASFFCVLSICGLLTIMNIGHSQVKYKLMILVLGIFIILYQSKAAFICLIIAIVISVYYNSQNWLVSTVKMLLIGLGMIVIGFIFFKAPIMGVISRFNVEDISSGRFNLFKFYNSIVFSDCKAFLFGIGLSKYNWRLLDMYGTSYCMNYKVLSYVRGRFMLVVSHNSVQEILLTWGAIGMILTIWLIRNMMIHKRKNIKFMNYLTLFFVLGFSLQGQFFSSALIPLALIFSLLCLEYRGRNDELIHLESD